MPCHWPLLLLQSAQKKKYLQHGIIVRLARGAWWEIPGKRCLAKGAWQKVPGKRCLAKGARQEVPKAGESKHSCNCNRQLASCAIRWCESKYMHFFFLNRTYYFCGRHCTDSSISMAILRPCYNATKIYICNSYTGTAYNVILLGIVIFVGRGS